MSRKRIAGPHSSSHRQGNPAKKPLSLHWPLERHFSSPWITFLLVNLSGKCRFPSGTVAVSQTCTLLSQAGRSLKSGPDLDALPEQALPTDWGTGTRTTSIGWFLWQPSY